MENNIDKSILRHALNLITEAVYLCGDGGIDPFTIEERKLMNNFLNKIEKDDELECK